MKIKSWVPKSFRQKYLYLSSKIDILQGEIWQQLALFLRTAALDLLKLFLTDADRNGPQNRDCTWLLVTAPFQRCELLYFAL